MLPKQRGDTERISFINKLRGFTLIELLVVIAIIALLMAILMPALQRVKKQAQAVRCRAHLKQWGVIFAMYTGDNDNKFMHWNAGVWVEPLRPYYKDGGEAMRVCPTATRILEEGALHTFAAWDRVNQYTEVQDIYRGSFGINNWVYNRPPGADSSTLMWGNPSANNWMVTEIKGANNVPLFQDCWRWGGAPYDTRDSASPSGWNEPPPYEDIFTNGFGRFCLNRHNGTINSCFVDFTVRAIGLKEMWRLKWHRFFDINAESPVWPGWMSNFRDY
ncbi:MAG: type II secretion system protein [Planctomycetota bacterium]|jgi:prepilin-type N-terminal cleavage/methylation domain-containing protein